MFLSQLSLLFSFLLIERKTSVFSSNSQAVITHSKSIISETNILSAKLNEFVKSVTQTALKLQAEATQYQTKELQTLITQSDRIEEQLKRFHEATQVMQEKDGVSDEVLGVIQSTLKDTCVRLKASSDAWGESLQKSCAAICKDVESSSVSGFVAVEKALKAMGSLVETIEREAQEYVHSEHKSILQANNLADDTVNTEITRLRQQNEMLTRLLENERTQSERAKDELIQRVSGLLGEFTKERDRKLTEVVSALQRSNAGAEEGMQAFGNKHADLLVAMGKRGEKVGAILDKRSGEGKRTRDGALKVVTVSSFWPIMD